MATGLFEHAFHNDLNSSHFVFTFLFGTDAKSSRDDIMGVCKVRCDTKGCKKSVLKQACRNTFEN